jgi:Type I phosphodiesterase / nucleotide pyrophosphatase
VAPMNNLSWATYGLQDPALPPGGDLLHRLVPEQVQPDATAFERAAASGITVTLVGPRQHAHSGMTRAVLRGGRYRSAFTLPDLVAVAAATLAEPGPQLVYAYSPDLDLVGHIRGVDSEAWRLQLGEIDQAAAALAERLPPGCLLAVTGDHGMVDIAPEDRLDVGDLPHLLAGVRVLGGEARARHVYTEPGAADDVLAAWGAVLGDRMWVVSRDQAIAAGWFGPLVSDRIRPRIGDVVAAAHGRIGVMQRAVDPAHARMRGHHGSMTAREQLVPLITVNR